MEILNGAQLKEMILLASRNLTAQKDLVDSLNVFPVPDGDTGTNMALTLQAAAREVQKLNSEVLGEVIHKAANGALMGARGNSGVILSQLLRGFAQGIGNKATINSKDMAHAFQAAVDMAYKGVMKPIEGTILTVAREAAKAAQDNCRRISSVEELLKLTIRQAKATLDQTPNMLPVLKQVGVVDAGGKGLVVILEGALSALTGEEIGLEPETAPLTMEAIQGIEIVDDIDLADIKFHYCTEFIIKGQNLPLDSIKVALEPLGDSMMVVGTEDVAKVHIHSNHPGQVLEICLGYGTLHEIKIGNMVEQHQELQTNQVQQQEASKAYGLVAVAVGEGMCRIFKSLGVDQIVEGGQTANPSIEDIVKAISAVNAERVFVLPNNKNIILAAEQAKDLVEKEVIVIPTRSVTQGIAALVAFDGQADVQTNQERMVQGAGRVVTGEVTYAVRDSKFEDRDVREGDILGLGDGKLKVVGKEISDVVGELVAQIMPEHGEILTIFYGQDVSEEEARNVVQMLEEAFPDCEVELHLGGQPLYYYIFSIE